MRSVSQGYRHACHMRVKQFLEPHGELLLDAASGPVQYREYLSYSEAYQHRVCVDFSWKALDAARQKLGDHGLYVLADITQLPFADETFDGVVSLHTIYHVPLDEQPTAFFELYRTLRAGKTGAIVYAWKQPLLLKLIQKVRSIPKKIQKILSTKSFRSKPSLYFRPRTYRQTVGILQEQQINFEIRSWRSASVPFLRNFIPDNQVGRKILSMLYQLEENFPHALGRMGKYPLIILKRQ